MRNNGFITLDDRLYITQNPPVARGIGAQGLVWAFTTTHGGNWHPLTWLSHMLDVELFGVDPGPHHLTSLALHATSALLLLFWLHRITGALWHSFFAAALFAVHPMRVESVAWASERKDVLAMVFTLLALGAYLRGLRRPGGADRFAATGFFAAALLAKPMPVTFPFLLLLLDWWPLGRWQPRRRDLGGAGLLPPWALWREKIPLFFLATASSIVTFVAQSRAGAVTTGADMPLAVRAINAVASCGEYILGTLWPRDLAVFYPHPAVVPPWLSWVPSLALLVALTAAAWRFRDRLPCLPVGWFWFLGALVPMLGLVQVGGQIRADRYLYLPHIGLFVAAVWGAAATTRGTRARGLLAFAGCVALLGCAVGSASLVSHWRSSIDLFGRALALAQRRLAAEGARTSPAMSLIHNNLGQAYREAGRLEESILQYRSALALNPSSAVFMSSLARVLEEDGRTTEAIALYVRALADPDLAEPRVNLGNLQLARGQVDDAVRLYREAAAIDPAEAVIRANLGAALATRGERVEAERELRAAVALAPEHEPARFNFGRLLLEQRRYEEAIVQLAESVRLEPGQAEARLLLDVAMEALAGREEDTQRALRGARALESPPAQRLPESSELHPLPTQPAVTRP